MKRKPDIQDFLEGGTEIKATVKPMAQEHTVTRITKTIRLATDLEAAIKEAAHERWRQTGKKVSESDIIEDALRKYLGI